MHSTSATFGAIQMRFKWNELLSSAVKLFAETKKVRPIYYMYCTYYRFCLFICFLHNSRDFAMSHLEIFPPITNLSELVIFGTRHT